MDTIPEKNMPDTTISAAFLHATPCITPRKIHDQIKGITYTFGMKLGINNRHRARVGKIPENMTGFTISAILLHQKIHITPHIEHDKRIKVKFTLVILCS